MKDISFLTSKGIDVNKSLEIFGDIETYNDTVGEFLVGAKNKLEKLETYKNVQDMNNYAIYAHSLKSDARYFGFTTLYEIAYAHELKSKDKDIYYIFEHFNELVAETNKYMEIIRQYITDDETSEKQATINTKSSYNSKTILVVDDSNIVRNFVKRIFNDTYEVGTAKDGKEAIDIIEANKNNDNIVAILLDLNMPNVNGFTVLEYMKNNDLLTKMPTSIISGDSTKETIDKAFTYQIVDMLGKPFNELDVKRVVEKTIYFKQMN